MASSLDAALADADVILLIVKHTEFMTLDPQEIAAKTKARIAIDCVNGWKANAWKEAGFQFHRLGDRKSSI
jgi:UDP-N-acetyl-D-mannosaminuronate dehydrogenase